MTVYGDSTQVRLAPAGAVWIAPLGAALPTDVTTAMATVDPSYKELGYLTEDGVTITPNVDTNDINAWQSATPVKTTLTGVGLQVKVAALQVTQNATAEYFFGQAWVNSGGLGKLTMPSTPSLAERTMVIEWIDDEAVPNKYRLLLGRGFLTDRDAMQLQRTEATVLGMTFQVLDNAGTLATILTNNSDLVPAT